MIKHQIKFLFFLMIVFSCKENTKIEKIKEIGEGKEVKTTEQDSLKIIRSDTLFLGLSPNMSENEFQESKIKEDGNRLQKGTFQIFLNNQTLGFGVHKKPKSIELYHSEYYSINELTNQELFNKKFNELFLLFNKKYKYHNYPDFTSHISFDDSTKTYFYYNPQKKEEDSLIKHLNEYGFDGTNYAIFNDSIKTIVIGFSNIKNKNTELMSQAYIPTPFVDGKNKGADFTNKPPVERKKIEYNDIKMFNLIIKINYFLNKDFDSIINVIKEDDILFLKSLKSKNDKRDNRMKKLEENKSEL